ncbi:MAG: aspartyl aminopeptidase, partial [Halioglobus sp.]
MTQALFNQQLCDFISRSTTPFHAVESMVAELAGAGFEELDDQSSWSVKPGGKYFLCRNGSSLVAFVVGTASAPVEGMRMVGAHTDSPCLMVKPLPENNREGYFQLGVEVYGGALLNPWFDRDLSLAGRVTFEATGGLLKSALIDFHSAIATIPSLAI